MRIFKLNILISSLAIFLLILSSCNDKYNDANLGKTILNTMSSDKILNGNTRAYPKSEEQIIKFTVIHGGDLTQMMANGADSNFKALLDSHKLKVESSFEIDEDNKGVVLISSTKLIDPVGIGKEFSMLDEVMMVEIGGVKEEPKTVS